MAFTVRINANVNKCMKYEECIPRVARNEEMETFSALGGLGFNSAMTRCMKFVTRWYLPLRSTSRTKSMYFLKRKTNPPREYTFQNFPCFEPP